jgi:hypothetical protein
METLLHHASVKQDGAQETELYSGGFDRGGSATLALVMATDVDMKIPGIPHRGPTHTVWFAAAVGAVATIVGALMGTWYSILGVWPWRPSSV